MLKPWDELPSSDPSLEVSLLVPLPLPHRGRPLSLVLGPIIEVLEARWPRSFEVIVAPFGPDATGGEPELQLGGAEVNVLAPLRGVDLRGAALRGAFLRSRGRVILTLHAEQPCDPGFFARAYDEIARGAELARANRRISESRFRIPVSVLPKVYARHRYGLAFNRMIRMMLPIETRDTSAGNLALSRRMASTAFALQGNEGFLFDLEIALIATDFGFVQRDLPERLFLYEEKTVSRIAEEGGAIFFGVPKLWWRHVRGYYRERETPRGITADDWGISPGVNHGILDLARRGIVRRVSMMADAPYLEESLDELHKLDVEMGLHFNLTHGKPFGSPARFLFRWMTARRASHAVLRDAVRAELRSQLDRLEAAGVRASYMDGHHHIHIVPGVTAAIADILAERGIRDVRLPYDPSLWLSRLAPVNVLSLALRRTLDARGLRYRR
ncbi:MAG: ChbG/HpnK family deacetylase, partial [Thermoanaerobaculia bacterium]